MQKTNLQNNPGKILFPSEEEKNKKRPCSGLTVGFSWQRLKYAHPNQDFKKKKNSVVFMYEQIGNLGKKMKTIQKELNGNSRTGNNWNFIGWA